MSEKVAAGPRHLMAFGAVIQWFARHELLIQTTMAGIAGIDLGTAVVLTAGLSYAAKRDALLSLVNTTDLPDEIADTIRRYLDDLHRHNGLRNAIAHSMWVQGSRPGAIKPMRLIVRRGVGRPMGLAEDEPDHTVEDLLGRVADLAGLYHRFVEFLLARQLIKDVAAVAQPA